MKFQIVSVIAALALIAPVLAMPHDDKPHLQKCKPPISLSLSKLLTIFRAKQATHTYVFLLLRILFFGGAN